MILIYKSSWTTASALEKMAISQNRVGMAMDADVVINPVRKIDGSVSRIDLRFITRKLLRDLVSGETLLYFFLIAVSDHKKLSLYQNDRIGTLQKTDMSLLRSISDGLISRLILSFCTLSLSDSSFFLTIYYFAEEKQGERKKQA